MIYKDVEKLLIQNREEIDNECQEKAILMIAETLDNLISHLQEKRVELPNGEVVNIKED